jgi:hypothetical protein
MSNLGDWAARRIADALNQDLSDLGDKAREIQSVTLRLIRAIESCDLSAFAESSKDIDTFEGQFDWSWEPNWVAIDPADLDPQRKGRVNHLRVWEVSSLEKPEDQDHDDELYYIFRLLESVHAWIQNGAHPHLGICQLEGCGRVYIKSRTDSKYCSSGHAKTAWSRRQKAESTV